MAFITTSLPNAGRTTHFAFSYEDTLSKADGLDQAVAVLAACEQDLQWISGWFAGVRFEFSFPIQVQIADGTGGASWTDPPDISLSGFSPTVTVKAGAGASSATVRFLLVAEVTEMYMASQRLWWFRARYLYSGADEGSMGESLSRFLAAQFLHARNLSKSVPPESAVVPFWVNDPMRPNFVDVAPDDNMPDVVTGCGTCFLFYLHSQLGFTIGQIIGASAPTLGGVYQNLTGKNDGWSSFKDLVDLHYPQDGSMYLPPMENLFPVADLHTFSAPGVTSWVVNGTPNIATVFLSRPIEAGVRVTLTSDDRDLIGIAATVNTTSFAPVRLTVPEQAPDFTEETVTLSASYGGRTLKKAVKVVRPENLPLPALEIVPLTVADPCAQAVVEGDSQDFAVKSVGAIIDHTGLSYDWSVANATVDVTYEPVLNIPILPPAGTRVMIDVTVKNASGIRAHGHFAFTTVERRTGLAEQLRYLDCSLRRLDFQRRYVPPGVPVEEAGVEILDGEQLVGIREQSERVAAAAEQVLTAIEALTSPG
jgi:hypothetical protein